MAYKIKFKKITDKPRKIVFAVDTYKYPELAYTPPSQRIIEKIPRGSWEFSNSSANKYFKNALPHKSFKTRKEALKYAKKDMQMISKDPYVLK